MSITAADVLRFFPGATVVATGIYCEPCSKPPIPEWRRGGKLTLRTWPDGNSDWHCSFCGRAAKNKKNVRRKKEKEDKAAA
jgi:hypothetical protein